MVWLSLVKFEVVVRAFEVGAWPMGLSLDSLKGVCSDRSLDVPWGLEEVVVRVEVVVHSVFWARNGLSVEFILELFHSKYELFPIRDDAALIGGPCAELTQARSFREVLI